MREILFRGKSLKTNKWVYGSCNLENTLASISCCAVIPKTIGQYTGLKDLHGTRIFEGDVVTHKSYVVDVYYNNEYAGFYPFYDADSGAGYGVEAKNCEIIGNIHDNPELLGGEKNG